MTETNLTHFILDWCNCINSDNFTCEKLPLSIKYLKIKVFNSFWSILDGLERLVNLEEFELYMSSFVGEFDQNWKLPNLPNLQKITIYDFEPVAISSLS